MKIHFCKSTGLGAMLIRFFTFSRWNHVAIEVGGVVFEAVTRAGVRAVPAHNFPRLWGKVESVDIAVPDQVAAERFLKAQLGKPYDWKAIFALPFRESWHRAGKWFCSELVAEALLHGGRPLNLPSHRVTPRDLYIALPEVGVISRQGAA